MTIENLKLREVRIVSGNPTGWEQAKDYHSGELQFDKTGQPKMQNWVHVAMPKQRFFDEVWPLMVQEAMAKYPNAGQIHPDNYDNDRFAWKIINGDSPLCPPKSKVPYNTREGYPGHYIIKLSTHAFCPDTVVFQNGAYRKIDANQIKTGDYIDASVTLMAHADKDGGLYWNPNIYELVKLGQAIVTAGASDPNKLLGDASQRTGGFQGQLPQAGQVAQHLPQLPNTSAPAGVATGLPMMGNLNNGHMTAPALAAPLPQQGSYAPVNTGHIQPAHDFVQNVMGHQLPQQPPAASGGQANQFAMPQLPNVHQTGVGIAGHATTLPNNVGIPGLPQPR